MSFFCEPTVAAPYPGLRPFLRDESQVFFGRDQQIDEVLARLKRNQFLGVVGTSGCGKSSLIRAGILPALESGLMGEIGSTWFVADMKPGNAPLTNLAKALVKSGVLGERWSDTPDGIALLAAALRRSDVSLVNLIQQVQLPPYTNLLVLADQFEEVFRFQQQDPNEALAFVNLLLSSGRDRSASIYVVLTMRTDYLGQCALFPGLPEALNDSQYLCPRLSRDQLRAAIDGPASVFGAEVEPSLVMQILNDAGANSDQLPLVQHVLARMCYGTGLGRTDRILRLNDYRDAGGLNGSSPQHDSLTSASSSLGHHAAGNFIQNALSQHADEAYFSLRDGIGTDVDRSPGHKPSRRQMIAQMLFRCLAERGPSGQYVRRPMKVEDVAAVAGCSVSELIEVVEVFRREDRSFLVPAVGVTLDAQSVLDISHEALIRQWHRFGGQSEQMGEHASAQSWLEVEEQSRRRYRRLAEAAENEQTAGLLRDPELGFLNQWWNIFSPTPAWADACVKDSFGPTMSLLERSLEDAERIRKAAKERDEKQKQDLLDKAEAETKRAEAEAERARDAESAACRFRRLMIAAGIAFLLAIVFMVLALLKWREANVAAGLAAHAELQAQVARDTAIDALRLQMKMFTDPVAICSRIAAVASAESTVEDKTAKVQALLDELDSHVSTRTALINMHIEHLRQNVNSWEEQGSIPEIDRVHHSVLSLAKEYRSAWEQSAKGLQPETRRLCRKLLIEPAYARVIDVTQQLKMKPDDVLTRAEFESLYWGELVFVETPEVEAAMVGFRKGLEEDDANLPALASRVESAVQSALDESANASPE